MPNIILWSHHTWTYMCMWAHIHTYINRYLIDFFQFLTLLAIRFSVIDISNFLPGIKYRRSTKESYHAWWLGFWENRTRKDFQNTPSIFSPVPCSLSLLGFVSQVLGIVIHVLLMLTAHILEDTLFTDCVGMRCGAYHGFTYWLFIRPLFIQLSRSGL